MEHTTPLVSIGLPVFNGEDYLEAAVLSLLQQTYANIEIIITDNASNDGTAEIVATLAKQDSRIKYYCSEVNLGAAKNYNRSFELSSGKYFKWAAHDDYLDKQYLEKCVAVLESDSNIVLVHPRTGQIDENGAKVDHEYVYLADVLPASSSSADLYRRLIRDRGSWTRIFGLIRTDILATTPLIESYIGSDLTLLGELGLRGRVADIEEMLFWRREHGRTSTRGAYKARRKRLAWFDSEQDPIVVMPEWRLSLELAKSVIRQDVSVTVKGQCLSVVVGRMWKRKKILVEDIVFAGVDIVAAVKNRVTCRHSPLKSSA